MSLPVVLLLVAGLVLLTVGADGLVRGASRLAAAAGVSPLVVGLTVVAYGTSAPEVAVSLRSSFTSEGGVALGNVVGSNVFNVLFILGLSSLLRPLVVHRHLVRLDVPFMVAVSFLPLLMGLDGVLGRWDGIGLLLLAVAYTVVLLRLGRSEPAHAPVEGRPRGRATLVSVALLVGGLGLLVLGSDWLVSSAVTLARAAGVSELVVGLTVVAAGTSLPELATSVMATIRGERDIAVGNVVGSNVFNVLVVLGLAAVLAPGGLPVPHGVVTFDLPVMIAVALACVPIFFTGWSIDRWEGGVFLFYYAVYLVALVLDATDHPAHGMFVQAVVGFGLPLTVLTTGVVWWRQRRRGVAT